MIDMTNAPYDKCDGVYKETSIFDDIDGVLHYNKCNAKTPRWKENENGTEIIEQK